MRAEIARSTTGLIFHKYMRKGERKAERIIAKIIDTRLEGDLLAIHIHLGVFH
jgi:hypothetical protein